MRILKSWKVCKKHERSQLTHRMLQEQRNARKEKTVMLVELKQLRNKLQRKRKMPTQLQVISYRRKVEKAVKSSSRKRLLRRCLNSQRKKKKPKGFRQKTLLLKKTLKLMLILMQLKKPKNFKKRKWQRIRERQ